MSHHLLILPHQLYDISYIKSLKLDIKSYIKSVILWEHPHYFKAYQYNKKNFNQHNKKKFK